MARDEHAKKISKIYSSMIDKVGDAKTMSYVNSSLTIMEFLSAEGILAIMSNDFFDGCLPDTMHTPIGYPLLIAMACRIAAYPERYNIATQDCEKQLNYDICAIFESSWMNIGRAHVYAIDIAIESGRETSQTYEVCE
jgi:hypothetical protein